MPALPRTVQPGMHEHISPMKLATGDAQPPGRPCTRGRHSIWLLVGPVTHGAQILGATRSGLQGPKGPTVRPLSKDKPNFSEGPSVFLPRGAYGAIPLFPLPLVFLPISPISPLIPPFPPVPPPLVSLSLSPLFPL